MQEQDTNAVSIEAAVMALARGGLIAYPTEAVFGLGCDPADGAAVERLLALKQRPMDKGLILIAADLAALRPWLARIADEHHARVAPTWPGPTTWLLPAAPDCPRRVRGEHDTLAVRVTVHPVAAALCSAWGGALVSTSANLADEAPVRDAATIQARFGDRLDAVVAGPLGEHQRPTPIRDARDGTTIRE